MENSVEPAQEQRKELWEWCGFTLRCPPEKDAYSRGIWNYPEGTYGDLELDLNNLFKYAVPKLLWWQMNNWGDMFHVFIGYKGTPNWIGVSGNDPALTLFWAIYEIVKFQNKTGR